MNRILKILTLLFYLAACVLFIVGITRRDDLYYLYATGGIVLGACTQLWEAKRSAAQAPAEPEAEPVAQAQPEAAPETEAEKER